MNTRVIIAFFIAFLATNLSAAEKTNSPLIIGTWELVDITSFTVMDSPPRGLSARKEYFSADGKWFFIEPEAKLTPKTISFKYTFKDGKLTGTPPNGEPDVILTPVFPDENTMKVNRNKDGNQVWTYRRMAQKEAYNIPIEPRSVVCLRAMNPTNQLSCSDIHYDTNDYSKLALKERCIGIWEELSYKNVPGPDVPPMDSQTRCPYSRKIKSFFITGRMTLKSC